MRNPTKDQYLTIYNIYIIYQYQYQYLTCSHSHRVYNIIPDFLSIGASYVEIHAICAIVLCAICAIYAIREFYAIRLLNQS